MSLAYFRMYPTDFEADTSHLTLEEDGAYNRLLRLCWRTPGCSLPDDHQWIMRRLRVSQEDYDRVVRVVIEEFFKVDNQRVFNKRLTAEFADASHRHEIACQNGRKGGRKPKSLKSNEIEKADGSIPPKPKETNGKANQNQNQNQNQLKEDTNVSSKKRAKPKKPSSSMPSLWASTPHAILSEKNRPAALKAGMTAKDAADATEQFVSYHLSKDSRFVDWDAAWRTWCGNFNRFGASSSGNRSQIDRTQASRDSGQSSGLLGAAVRKHGFNAGDSERAGSFNSGSGRNDTELCGGGGGGAVFLDAPFGGYDRRVIG